jgi:hypothetical protein
VFLDKDRTMDNVQQHNIFTNVPSSQTFRSYLLSTVAERLIGIFPDDVILLMTDEARGHVNKQNSQYWAEENPQQLHQQPLYSAHVTV